MANEGEHKTEQIERMVRLCLELESEVQLLFERLSSPAAGSRRSSMAP